MEHLRQSFDILYKEKTVEYCRKPFVLNIKQKQLKENN